MRAVDTLAFGGGCESAFRTAVKALMLANDCHVGSPDEKGHYCENTTKISETNRWPPVKVVECAPLSSSCQTSI